MAISAFPLIAAETEVNSSGSEVPNATIVSPIKRSLIPMNFAIAVAAFTVTSLPKTIKNNPTTVKTNSFHTG